MSKSIFISGTGYNCGKSLFSAILARAFLQKAKRVGYLNMIETVEPGTASTTDMVKWITRGYAANFDIYNGYKLRKKCSPHLAFELEGNLFDFESIKKKFSQLRAKNDFVIFDSPGNSLTQITRYFTNADIANELGLPVILVTPNNITSIANISVEAEAYFARGIEVTGCVLNNVEIVDPIINDDNKKTIEQDLQINILEQIPFIKTFKVVNSKIPQPLYTLSKSIAENNLNIYL